MLTGNSNSFKCKERFGKEKAPPPFFSILTKIIVASFSPSYSAGIVWGVIYLFVCLFVFCFCLLFVLDASSGKASLDQGVSGSDIEHLKVNLHRCLTDNLFKKLLELEEVC